jgi:hypothetical protein
VFVFCCGVCVCVRVCVCDLVSVCVFFLRACAFAYFKVRFGVLKASFWRIALYGSCLWKRGGRGRGEGGGAEERIRDEGASTFRGRECSWGDRE